jgi:hypothetical protein
MAVEGQFYFSFNISIHQEYGKDTLDCFKPAIKIFISFVILWRDQEAFTLGGQVLVRSRIGHFGSLKEATFVVCPEHFGFITIPDDSLSYTFGAKTEDSMTWRWLIQCLSAHAQIKLVFHWVFVQS